MTRRLDYRWHLRQVMAGRGMFATTDLIGPLADRGRSGCRPARSTGWSPSGRNG